MKVIILCAGKGTRLGSLTSNTPKCLVKLNSHSILERLLNQLLGNGLKKNQIYLCAGYKSDLLPKNYKKFINLKFETTNMMKTTIIGIEGALKYMSKKENLLIIYGDCIYSDLFIKEIIIKTDKFSKITMPVDLDWKSKWSNRYENIYEDAETLKYDLNSFELLSIGKKTFLEMDYMAQFMGIYILPNSIIRKYIDSYKSLKEDTRNKISTTTFFENTNSINKVYVMPGIFSWTEVDTPEDLFYAKKTFS